LTFEKIVLAQPLGYIEGVAGIHRCILGVEQVMEETSELDDEHVRLGAIAVIWQLMVASRRFSQPQYSRLDSFAV